MKNLRKFYKIIPNVIMELTKVEDLSTLKKLEQLTIAGLCASLHLNVI